MALLSVVAGGLPIPDDDSWEMLLRVSVNSVEHENLKMQAVDGSPGMRVGKYEVSR